jgi:phosphate transport system substrate-binding protein
MLFLVVLCSLCLAAADSAAETVKLKGSGASFPFPLYGRWFKEYGKVNKQVQVDYQAKGSGAGMKDFVNKTVDCTASDAAMRDEQTAAVGRGVQLLPVVAGSLVLAYNLDGLGGDLKLTRDVYVDIFLGKVTTWDDPRIAAINAGLRLPTTNIALVVRQDSSGTTYAFTNHLSAISETWRDQGPGVGVAIAWPSHPIVAHGNEGVAERIKVSQGAIGYVEYGIAQRAGLSMAWLENRAGQFVQPHGGSGLATLLNVTMRRICRPFSPTLRVRTPIPL